MKLSQLALSYGFAGIRICPVPMSRGNFRCSRNAGRCGQVFNKDPLVLRLVVEQLIGYPANHGNAESAWTYAELIADVRMCNRVVRRLTNGSVGQAFEAKAWAGVCHAIQQQARGAHLSNPHFAVRIQLSAPLNGVE